MGAWFFVAPRIENLMEAAGIEQRRLAYAGRRPSASPATGFHAQHERELAAAVEDAFRSGPKAGWRRSVRGNGRR